MSVLKAGWEMMAEGIDAKRFHRLPCSRMTCLLDIAWLGNLAGQGAVLDAGVHASCIGAYMVALAVVLALHGDTHVS